MVSVRVFKILCQPSGFSKLMYSSSRSGKWIVSCDNV